MIQNDLLPIFTESYRQAQYKGEDLILDQYRLKDGIYIIIDKETFEPIDTLKIRYKKGEMLLEEGSEQYLPFLRYADYYSKLQGGTNRALGPKTVLSNNKLTFFVSNKAFKPTKKSESEAINIQDVENHFDILMDLSQKYGKKKNDKELYESIKNTLPDIDCDDIERFKAWVITWCLENASEKKNILKENKPYKRVRIYRYDAASYKNDYFTEGMRQIKQCLYIKNDFNQKIDGDIYGLSSFCINTNINKPFLIHQNRKTETPTLIDIDTAWQEKQMVDYFAVQASNQRNNLYFSFDPDIPIQAISDYGEKPEDFRGIYVRLKMDNDIPFIDNYEIINIKKSDALEIEIIPRLMPHLKNNQDDKIYRTITTMNELEDVISRTFFKNCLRGTYHRETQMFPSVLKNDVKLMLKTTTYNGLLYDWFHQGRNNVDGFLKMANQDIYNEIGKVSIYQTVHQFDVAFAIAHYFKKEGDLVSEKIMDELFLKINVTQTDIENQDEYYFAIGTLLSYIVSKQQTKEKQPLLTLHHLLTPQKHGIFINKVNDFIRRNMHILDDKYGKKPKRLYKMILDYSFSIDKKAPINQEHVLIGVLSENLLYWKF